MRLPVLLYHHVGRTSAGLGPSLTVSASRFEMHVGWLARRGYSSILPSEWFRACRNGTVLPDKPVMLTFDDAYADVADYALPVLQRYGFGAAIFVVTGHVGGTNEWDRERTSHTHRLMTADQIRYWANQGIEFGAHSRTHPDLTRLSGTELQEEVLGSAIDLERILDRRVVSFAYPYGTYNQTVRDCVRGIFNLAFSTNKGLNDRRTESDLLRRTGVRDSDSLISLECYTRWGWNPLQYLRAKAPLKVHGSLFP